MAIIHSSRQRPKPHYRQQQQQKQPRRLGHSNRSEEKVSPQEASPSENCTTTMTTTSDSCSNEVQLLRSGNSFSTMATIDDDLLSTSCCSSSRSTGSSSTSSSTCFGSGGSSSSSSRTTTVSFGTIEIREYIRVIGEEHTHVRHALAIGWDYYGYGNDTQQGGGRPIPIEEYERAQALERQWRSLPPCMRSQMTTMMQQQQQQPGILGKDRIQRVCPERRKRILASFGYTPKELGRAEKERLRRLKKEAASRLSATSAAAANVHHQNVGVDGDDDGDELDPVSGQNLTMTSAAATGSSSHNRNYSQSSRVTKTVMQKFWKPLAGGIFGR